MQLAVKICLCACGVFFMIGLFTGTWKYFSIRASANHKAHPYINIAHQASLAYAFACLVLAKFVEFSPFSSAITSTAAALAIYHFAFAIVAYIIHGATRDTDNQFRPPYTLGPIPIPKIMVSLLMWTLILSEIVGAGVLFWGFLQTQIFSA